MASVPYIVGHISTVITLFTAILHRQHGQVNAAGRFDRKLFCYYSSFAQNRPDAGKFVPENINPDLCTHVIFAFADIEGTRLKASGWNDLESGKDAGLYQRTAALKQQNPHLKVLLAVGGWRVGSAPFVTIVSSEKSRRAFAANAADFVRGNGFDGLDVDWEFPGSRGSGPEHKALFTLLLKDLREAFEYEAQDSGRDRLLLTAAAAGGSYYIELAYETRHIAKYVDYLLVMAYNYHGSWNKFTGHHAGLFPRSDEVAGEREWNQAWTIDYWLNKAGVPKEKVIIGISTYGTTFTLADPSRHGLKAVSTGPGKAGKYTQEPGTLSYYEICDNLNNGWKSVWVDEQKAPYAYSGDQWVCYDNIDSVTFKAQYLMKQNAGGAFIWSLEMDDFQGSCGTGKYPLLSTIASILGIQSSGNRAPAANFDFDDDEFYPTRHHGGVEQRSRAASERWRGDDRDRQTSRVRDRSFNDVDDDDYYPRNTARASRNEHSRVSSDRHRQQSRDFDDVTSGRSSQRRPTFTDDFADNLRRYDETDSSRPRYGSDRHRESRVDDGDSKRRRRPDTSASFRSTEYDRSDRDGRRSASAGAARKPSSDSRWNELTTSSTYFDNDAFSSNQRASSVDDRNRFRTGPGRRREFDNNPRDENPSCQQAGVFPQPGTDCKSYYVCVQHSTSWHQFFMSCPRGKMFSVALAACETPSSSHPCDN